MVGVVGFVGVIVLKKVIVASNYYSLFKTQTIIADNRYLQTLHKQ